MAFDGAFLHTLVTDLNMAVSSRVEKIYQPSRDELVIHLKKKDFSRRLYISARNGTARICFTDARFENPASPPMFCMLARKMFSSARLVSVFQPGLERIIELRFESLNEMGDIVTPKIVCEFIGGANNIILCDGEGKISDALKRSDITASRIIMPGVKYTYPESRGKLNFLDCKAEEVLYAVELKGGEVSSALLNVLEGFSPLVCRELAFLAFGKTDSCLKHGDSRLITEPLNKCLNALNGAPSYTALYQNGTPKDFSFIDINQYGGTYEKRRFESASDMLEAFYTERDTADRIKKQSGDILKTVNNLLSRARRRKALRVKDLEATKNREDLRIYGEIIKANIHMIKPGDTYLTAQNFYDENLSEIRIKLDPALSPSGNAAKYFKSYKKSCSASVSLGALIESDDREIYYLDSVLESIERAHSVADISEIRQELVNSGYLKEKRKTVRNNSAPQIEQHVSTEGYKIFVGHNNIQNDYITTHLADKNDIWFHVKNIHGSHIVVKSGGGELTEETIVFAACLAAKNSRAKKSSNVPVDYTPVKYVKKPVGSKAGMVVYTTNKTVFVTPWEE